MSTFSRLLALLSLVMFVGAVRAESSNTSSPDAAKAAKQCQLSDCSAQQCEGCQDCPIAKAMQQLPKITLVVGEERTCCSEAAKALAEKLTKPVQYAVGEKTFATEAEATLALAEDTERFVKAFAEPSTCKVSGTTTVAGKTVCCSDQAADIAKLAKEAMDKVQLVYLVGDKQCSCPDEAKSLSVAAGKPPVFLVSGEKTNCKVTARLNLARAKYRAAVAALVQAESQKQTATN